MRRSVARVGAILAVFGTMGLGVAVGSAEAGPVKPLTVADRAAVCSNENAAQAAKDAVGCVPAPPVVSMPVTADPGTAPRFTLDCPAGSVLVSGSLTLTPEIRAIKVAEEVASVSFGIDGSELTESYSGTATVTCSTA